MGNIRIIQTINMSLDELMLCGMFYKHTIQIIQNACINQSQYNSQQFSMFSYSTPNVKNIVFQRVIVALDGAKIAERIQMSDELFQQYQGINELLEDIDITEMQLRSKKPDQKLPWYKSFFAKVANIKAEHEFLLLETEGFLITIDFYKENKIVVRIGDEKFVMEGGISLQRQNATIVTELNGLQWKLAFKKNQLKVGQVLKYLQIMKMHGQYSELSNRGYHFSRQLWSQFKKIGKK